MAKKDPFAVKHTMGGKKKGTGGETSWAPAAGLRLDERAPSLNLKTSR